MTTAPTAITFHKQSQRLTLVIDGQEMTLPSEFLRVYSPSAEVRGHGDSDGVLQVGKKEVHIRHMEYVGNYALKITYSDGHDSGLYHWQYLAFLGQNQDRLWQEYLDKLQAAGAQRDAPFIAFKSV